jgi:hypothetical protein
MAGTFNSRFHAVKQIENNRAPLRVRTADRARHGEETDTEGTVIMGQRRHSLVTALVSEFHVVVHAHSDVLDAGAQRILEPYRATK